jgi:hypothetical protein
MKWTKPNGNEIETNDEKATVDYCESLGWEEKKAPEVKIVRKKTRKVRR